MTVRNDGPGASRGRRWGRRARRDGSHRDRPRRAPGAPPPASQWTCDGRLAVGIDETDWVAFGCSLSSPGETSYVLFHRTLDGTWTEELAPFTGDGYGGVLVAAGTGESVALWGAAGFRLRSAAGWGPAEAVPFPATPVLVPFPYSFDPFAMVVAPDGERVAVGVESPMEYPLHPNPDFGFAGGFGVWLSERTATGWTVVQIGGPYNAFYARPYLSRTAQGELVITLLNPGPGEFPNASIYVEDP